MDPELAKIMPITPKSSRKSPGKASRSSSFEAFQDTEAGGLNDDDSDEESLDARAARALMPPRALRYLQLLLYFSSILTSIGASVIIGFAVWSIVDPIKGPFSLLPNSILYGIVIFAVFILISSLAGFCGTKMKQRKIMYLFLVTTLVTLLCQSAVAVLMLIKHSEYKLAAEHTYNDSPNTAYESFTESILRDWVLDENEKWTRYQNAESCCGYDVETYINGKALEINMMTGVACSKAKYFSFADIGAPIGNETSSALDDFRTKKRTTENMLSTTMALSEYSKLGTAIQAECVPEKSKDRTKQWYCPIALGETNVTASCTLDCLNAIRTGDFDVMTHETLMDIEEQLMCKVHIFKTARDFSLIVSLSALALCVIQIASVGTSCYLVFSYYAEDNVVVEGDDFDDDYKVGHEYEMTVKKKKKVLHQISKVKMHEGVG